MPPDALYAAEDQWSALLDRGGTVDFFGSRIDVPMQRRFGDVAAVQRYVDAVLSLASVRSAYPDAGPVLVRERSGQARAHYEVSGSVIALPMRERWAARESVVLHELAHHCACSVDDESAGVRWHGEAFQSAMDVVVVATLGDAAALLLRAGYDSAGVRR